MGSSVGRLARAALVLPWSRGNADGSLKVTDSRVLEAGDLTAAVMRISLAWAVGFLGLFFMFRGGRSGVRDTRERKGHVGSEEHRARIVKIQGEFTWHRHADTDEFFLVLSGQLTIQMRDRDVVLGPRELFVVPRGLSTARAPTPARPRPAGPAVLARGSPRAPR